MGRFHQGFSSQSRKINCKWGTNPFNGAAACILLHVLVVPVMLSSTRALATALLLVRAKRYQDQHDRLTTYRCSVSSSITLDYVGTVPLTLSASGKSPTMPRALCAFALSLAVLNSRAFDLRAPAECRAASERESPTPLPIASSWPLGSPCYLRCGHYCCWL